MSIIYALSDGISRCLPELIPAAVDALLTFAETCVDNIDEILNAAEIIIRSLADGLMKALPTAMEKAPEIIEKLCEKLIYYVPEFVFEVAVTLAEYLIETLANFDWTAGAEAVISGISGALKTAADKQAENEGYFVLGSQDEADARLAEARAELAEKKSEEIRDNSQEISEAVIEGGEEIKSAAETEAEDVTDAAETLDTALEGLEHSFKTHKISEEEYWAERKNILEKYRDDESEEWWELYDKVTEHYDKLSETEKKAAEKAAKEAENSAEKVRQAEEKAAKEYENSLKNSVTDKFRELETKQLENGYDDSWLLAQKRAFIETLDRNSEAYKDYNLRLLKEEQKADETLKKQAEKDADEAQKQAEKAAENVKKSYEAVKKSRDSLASGLKGDIGGVFSVSEDTEKWTGKKTKSRKTDTTEYEKKIAAKKKLNSKIAELLEKNAPMSLVKELLKLDPEDALYFANDLLKNPAKLNKISKDISEDESISNALANIVTENSEEFSELGTDAGNLFGDAFSEAFSENWQAAFDNIFGSEKTFTAVISAVNTANNSAAQSAAATPVHGENTDAGTAVNTAAPIQSCEKKYRILNINKTWLCDVVEEEMKTRKITGGG